MQLYTQYVSSPIGIIKVCGTESHIQAITFLNDAASEVGQQNDITSLACQQLEAYFKGDRKLFEIPMQQNGTPFQIKVWDLLYAIPYGKTISYMDLSKSYGDVKAIRAIASANGKNNLAVVVPCHRVIGSNRSLTGYAGGLWRKHWLLAHEAKHFSGVQQLF